MDSVIPLPRQQERLVKLLGAPSLLRAKMISFTWFELMDARPARRGRHWSMMSEAEDFLRKTMKIKIRTTDGSEPKPAKEKQ